MTAARLETISPARIDETLAFLATRPYDNVYVSWIVATNQSARGEVMLWRDERGALAGTCLLGSHIVPFAVDDAAIDAFGDRARRMPPPRMIVGPRPTVERLWARTRGALSRPVTTKRSQPVYALEPSNLPQADGEDALDVARATRDELDEIVPNAAQMIAGEIGGDPSRASHDFRSRTARIIDASWQWRYRVDGRLAFMCNVGSATPHTAQIQGVWSPPHMRGLGYATRGFIAICRRLLAEFPTLTLYVNDFNTPAIALYERAGFRRVGEFQTLLFD